MIVLLTCSLIINILCVPTLCIILFNWGDCRCGSKEFTNWENYNDYIQFRYCKKCNARQKRNNSDL